MAMDQFNHYNDPSFENNSPEQPQTPPQRPDHPAYTPPSSYNPYGFAPMEPPAQPPRNRKNGVAVGIIAVVCVAIVAGLSVLLALSKQPSIGGSATTTTTTGSSQPANTPSLEITELDEDTQGLSTRDIVKNNIDSTVLLTIYESYNMNFGFGSNGQSTEVEAGSATGIVMSADGYITNWHCVVDEDTNQTFPRIDVKLYNGTVYERATVIGADSSTDLAVIKVDATDLQPATFGDSTTLQLGDKVVALGNAGGLGFSASQGIVSGLARDVYEDTGYAIQCIQTDAAINPGNSGGPLFNAAGQVVAVNSAKIVSAEYEGLGFSIPINEAKTIINDLIQNGYVTGRVSLGITCSSYNDRTYQGCLIREILDASALKNTDAKVGDLIVKVNDEAVTDYASLRSALAKHKVGDTVTLTLLRSQNRQVNTLTVEVKLGEAKG